MTIAAQPLSQDALLEETARRLIDAVGLAQAILVCRANYMHGVLKILLGKQSSATGTPALS